MTRAIVVWITYTFLSVTVVTTYPSGPPVESSTCTNLIPGSNSPHRSQDGNGTYMITFDDLTLSNTTQNNNGRARYFEFTAGQTYNGTISSTSDAEILGFLLQAWDPSDTRIGTFSPGTGQKNLMCSSVNNNIANTATLTHSQRSPSLNISWVAPSGQDGLVDFRFTILRSRSSYFGPLRLASLMSDENPDNAKFAETKMSVIIIIFFAVVSVVIGI